MLSNLINTIIAAGVAIALVWDGTSLEMALLVGFSAGCFYTLCNISRHLRKRK